MSNCEITKEYIGKSVVVPVEGDMLYMHAFIDGVMDYRKKIEAILEVE